MPTAGRICTPEEREQIIRRDLGRCRYCGSSERPFQIDHVYPYSLGGITKVENLVTSCRKCNWKKHNSVGEWPKPIGYFEKKSHVNFPSLILFIFAVVMLYNSLDTVLNYPAFVDIGRLFGFLGITSGLLATVVHIRGVNEK